MAGTGGETSAQTLADSTSVLSTHGLTKDFNHLRAVDNLDLTVYAGDVFGFLGPNGAGKTTTIRLMFGLIYPTSGYVQVLDHRIPGARQEALRHTVSYTHLRAHETDSYLVCRLLLEKKK